MTLVCQSLLGRCGITPSQSTRRCWAGSRAARAVGFEARLRLMRMRMQLPGPGMQKIIIPNMLTAATSLAFFVFLACHLLGEPLFIVLLPGPGQTPGPGCTASATKRVSGGLVLGLWCLEESLFVMRSYLGLSENRVPPIPVVYHGLSWFIMVYHCLSSYPIFRHTHEFCITMRTWS